MLWLIEASAAVTATNQTSHFHPPAAPNFRPPPTTSGQLLFPNQPPPTIVLLFPSADVGYGDWQQAPPVEVKKVFCKLKYGQGRPLLSQSDARR